MNPVRVGYIAEIVSSLRHTANNGRVLQGMDVLDIGCGGGLLSESLARLGASVTGADAAAENIAMATHHASLDPSLTSDLLRYTHTTAEDLAQTGAKFDMITALEIIEHVSNPGEFVKTLSALLKPNGILFVSTMNRTQLSYLLTIFLAERVLRWVPNGTHDWEKYVKPEELVAWMGNAGCRVWDQKGLAFNPLLNSWKIVDPAMGGLEVNYILTAVKSR
ncbi:Hexaprenyldihydroxybenzoate methyltransferase, mitochondrial [Gaertneriomyces sp. JEL0708]|nr:Hexaprenyldihydroxybenzoate methyltransferase, mitochondrial [Gaertneriomyces sp. JEL0708]